jgi:hypothetical protein
VSDTGPSSPASVPQAATGVRALATDDFSILESVGGVRGLVESMLPGTVFVVVYVITRELTPTLWASLGVAALLVVARLVRGAAPTHALGGLIGVGVGVLWAAVSGKPENYFAAGLWTNGAYLAVCLVSVAVRWPAVGVVVELLRSGFGGALGGARTAAPDESSVEPVQPGEAAAGGQTAAEPTAFVFPTAWRRDGELLRRYAWATALWAVMFALRLAVQVPLYFDHEVGWLGTARLVMGLPLWGLTLWSTWLLVPHRPREARPEPAQA